MPQALSQEEVRALLTRMQGRHVPPRVNRIGSVVGGAVLAAPLIFFCVAGGRERHVPTAIVVLLCIAIFLLVARVVTDEFAEYEISPRGIEKFLLLRGRIWSIGAEEIQAIQVFRNQRWYLKLFTASRSRVIPLVGALEAALIPH